MYAQIKGVVFVIAPFSFFRLNMIDIKQLNTNFHQIALNLKKRGFKLSTDILRLYRVSLLNQRELEQNASDLNKGISPPNQKLDSKNLNYWLILKSKNYKTNFQLFQI